jgi:hypothetical protein
MSLDGPWPAAVVALAVPAGLGHFDHLVLAVNILGGVGCREAVLDRLLLILFSTFSVSSALLLRGYLQAPWWTWSWPLRIYPAL